MKGEALLPMRRGKTVGLLEPSSNPPVMASMRKILLSLSPHCADSTLGNIRVSTKGKTRTFFLTFNSEAKTVVKL
jgi:hypothetical protein